MPKLPCTRCRILFFALAPVVTLFLVHSLVVGHLLVNTSKSMPLGVYLTHPVSRLSVGDIVLACGPRWLVSNGYVAPSRVCQGRSKVLKPVRGLSGSRISWSARGGLMIDGTPTGAVALSTDHEGRALPHFAGGTVPLGSVFLLSTHNVNSADGRYFGFTKITDILGVYRCVLCVK